MMEKTKKHSKADYVKSLDLPGYGKAMFMPCPVGYNGQNVLFIGTDADLVTEMVRKSPDKLSVMEFDMRTVLNLAKISPIEGLAILCYNEETDQNHSMLWDRWMIDLLISLM